MLNKFRIPEMVLGALVGASLMAAIWGWADSFAPTEIQKQECYEAAKQAAQKTEECKSLWERTTSDPVAFFTFVLSISTFGLWAATIGLYVAGKRQLSLARDVLAIENRAFVFPAGFNVLWEPATNGTFNWRITIVWKNSGHTPTRNLRLYSDYIISETPIPITFDFNQIAVVLRCRHAGTAIHCIRWTDSIYRG